MKKNILNNKQTCLRKNVVLVAVLLLIQTGLSHTSSVKVFGVVSDEKGNGISQAVIRFISQDEADTISTQTDSSGAYSVQLTLTESGVKDEQVQLAKGFKLCQNYPNPFNPGTVIEFKLPQPEHVKLTIFNVNGQVVKMLADGYYPAGFSQVHWDGSSDRGRLVAAGVYFYRIETKQFTETRKMLLLDGGRTETPGRALMVFRKPLLKTALLSEKTFTIRAEKDGYFTFFEDEFVVSSEDTEIEKNIVLKDEGRILFTRNVKNELCQICTMKPDGSDLEIISEVEFGYNIGYIEARWSPDKSKIVVVGGPESSKDIYPLWLMDMKGNLDKKLANNGMDPVWQNENKVIFHRPRTYVGSMPDIYLLDIETNDNTLIFEQNDSMSITITDVNNTGDSVIGYFWNISLNSLLGEFNIDEITNYSILYDKELYRGVKPKLSPDEEKIIFAKGIYRKNDLYSLELETNTIVNITNDPGEYKSLSWSPDGNKITFSKRNSSLEGEFEHTDDIFLLDLAADTCINLTGSYSDSISSHIMDWK